MKKIVALFGLLLISWTAHATAEIRIKAECGISYTYVDAHGYMPIQMNESVNGCLVGKVRDIELDHLKYSRQFGEYFRVGKKAIKGTFELKVCGDKVEIRSNFAQVKKITTATISDGEISHLLSSDSNEKTAKTVNDTVTERDELTREPVDGKRVTEKIKLNCSLPLNVITD